MLCQIKIEKSSLKKPLSPETIQYSPKWRHIKEGHITAKDVVEHAIVQILCRPQDALCEGVPASGIGHALADAYDSVDGEIIVRFRVVLFRFS